MLTRMEHAVAASCNVGSITDKEVSDCVMIELDDKEAIIDRYKTSDENVILGDGSITDEAAFNSKVGTLRLTVDGSFH